MNKFFSVKGIESIADVDIKSRTVSGYFSRFGNVDLDGDMLMPGAFTKSIKERGSEGANLIVHLADHKMDTNNLLGKPQLKEVQDGGMFTTNISETTKGNDILKLYRDGVINQHSFGFKTVKNQQKSGYNEIQEVFLFEVSTVVLGANSSTPFTGFKGEFKPTEIIDTYKLLTKCYYDGDYSDDIFPILKAQIKQIENDIVNLYIKQHEVATQPQIIESTVPEAKKLQDAILLLTTKHF